MFGLLVAAVEVGQAAVRNSTIDGSGWRLALAPRGPLRSRLNQTAPLRCFGGRGVRRLRRGGTGDLLAGSQSPAWPTSLNSRCRCWRFSSFAPDGGHLRDVAGFGALPSRRLCNRRRLAVAVHVVSTVNAWMGYDVIHNWQSVSLVVTWAARR